MARGHPLEHCIRCVARAAGRLLVVAWEGYVDESIVLGALEVAI